MTLALRQCNQHLRLPSRSCPLLLYPSNNYCLHNLFVSTLFSAGFRASLYFEASNAPEISRIALHALLKSEDAIRWTCCAAYIETRLDRQ